MTSYPTVALLYGLAEGKLLSSRLRAGLRTAGFEVISDVSAADIIITHSGGCLLLPAHTAKRIIYVDYTYWPDKPLIHSMLSLVRQELSTVRYEPVRAVSHAVLHGLYLFQIRHTWQLARQWKYRQQLLTAPPPTARVFVRNRADPYADPEALLRANGTATTYVSLPGGHNDIWRDPRPYLMLLQRISLNL